MSFSSCAPIARASSGLSSSRDRTRPIRRRHLQHRHASADRFTAALPSRSILGDGRTYDQPKGHPSCSGRARLSSLHEEANSRTHSETKSGTNYVRGTPQSLKTFVRAYGLNGSKITPRSQMPSIAAFRPLDFAAGSAAEPGALRGSLLSLGQQPFREVGGVEIAHHQTRVVAPGDELIVGAVSSSRSTAFCTVAATCFTASRAVASLHSFT